jgi:hypothetical protein
MPRLREVAGQRMHRSVLLCATLLNCCKHDSNTATCMPKLAVQQLYSDMLILQP